MKEYKVTWCAEDIQQYKPEWTLEQCEVWLDYNFERMSEIMIERGFDMLNTFAWELFDPSNEAVPTKNWG